MGLGVGLRLGLGVGVGVGLTPICCYTPHASCDIPQELPDEEIDELLGLNSGPDEAAETHTPAKPVASRGNNQPPASGLGLGLGLANPNSNPNPTLTPTR